MESTRIASTTLLGLRPLGSAADRSYARIFDLLRTRVGQEAATLLAEPVMTADGRHIDWYMQGAVDAKPLSSVSAEDRERALAQLLAARAQVEVVAQQLATSATSADRNLASALTNAVNVPGDDFIYVIAGAPVLVAWGFLKEDVAQTNAVLGMRLPPAPAAAAAPASVATRTTTTVVKPVAAVTASATVFASWRPRWLPVLLWSLFAMLLVLLLWMLLTVCFFSIPLVGQTGNPFALTCGRGAASRAPSITRAPRAPEADRGARLMDDLRDLERQMQERLGQCGAEQTQSQPPQRPDMQARLDSANARSGEMQISLSWEGDSDVDLYVLCGDDFIGPSKRNGCGGVLDIDMNATYPDNLERFDSLSPVENMIWTSPPPRGEYKIAVELFYRRSDQRPEIPFKLRIRRGANEENLTGTVSAIKQKKIIKIVTE